ncbi:MAG: beta-galactosidase [Opitutaceae bacterium]|jgi:beta-galactosidase|nr:beta-galactosidase [Opitutaceae bacterium]
MLFGASYYPPHRDEADWSADLDTMVAAHVNALRLGDFAWSRLEPRDGEYDFGWLDRYLDLAHRKGVSVLLIPPLRCPPAWLFNQDKSMAIVNESGVALGFGSRYTFCINHPLFRRKGLELASRMAERYAKHPAVIGWHLDNEYGDEPDCHCPVCAAKWRDWLRNRYGTIEALNAAWGTVFWTMEFDDFEQIHTPRLTKTYHNTGLLQAWRHFRSDCTVEIVGLHAEAVRRHDPVRPITTNLQCLHNPRTNYHHLRKHLDVVGMNYYPAYGPTARANSLGIAVNRGVLGKNIHIHELRNGPHAVPGRPNNAPAPGEIERLTLHTIANGADAIFYFQWTAVRFGPEQSHGTPTGYDGLPNRNYPEVQRIGQKLARIAPALAGTEVRSDVAVIYDFPSRWAMQTGEEWTGPAALHNDHAKKIYNAIRLLGVNCDAIGRDGPFASYKLIVAPFLSCLDEALVDRLVDYVQLGGTLVFHPLCGMKNADTEIYPRRLHPKLEKLFGIDVRDFTTAGPGERAPFSWAGGESHGELFVDLVKPGEATVAARFRGGWWDGYPAVTERCAGAGRAVWIATFADEVFYRDWIADQLARIGVRSPLGYVPPAGIEVAQRVAEDGRALLFLINTTAERQSLTLPAPMRDLWNEDALSGEVSFEPWQVRITAKG